MADGSVWKDLSYNYSYAYEYYPSVTLCPNAGFMVMKGKKITLTPVSLGSSRAISNPKAPAIANDVIETNIDGEFNGWEGETIFKLRNGQIWQQSSYAYTYHYSYNPRVLIVPSRSGYIMQVEGVSGTISVQRLR